MGAEHLDIPDCPKCNDGHRYQLYVKRAMVIKMMITDMQTERPRTVKYTRLFTCPTSNEDFQARFTLTDTSSDRIEDVTVTGLASDE